MTAQQRAFNQWLEGVLPNDPISEVCAFNFNIAETSEAFVVELIGSPSFDPEDADWACDEIWTCRPSEFSLPYSEVGREWRVAEKFVATLVRGFLKDYCQNSALHAAEAVAIGFVGGELVQVWPTV